MTNNGNAELFDDLMGKASNPRLRQSLEHVREACDLLDSSRAAITPTSVARFCESRWGGPKAQSIRNATDTLFAYVTARRSAQVLPKEARKEGFEPQIRDEIVRAYVNLIKTERDEAIRNKNRIIAGLRSIPGIPIDDLLANGFKVVNASAAPPAISSDARRALGNLVDAEKLAAVGLELYRDRVRQSVTGNELLSKVDVEAIRGLLGGPNSGAIADQRPAPKALT